MSTLETEQPESDAIQRARGNSFVVDVWVNLKRWLTKSLRTKFVVAGSLIQPIFFLVLFTAIFGPISEGVLASSVGSDISYVTYITPAIIILSALDTATSSGIGLVDDMVSGMFEKVLVSPMNRVAMFLGKALSEVVRIVIQTMIILLLGYGMLWLETGGPGGVYIETGVLGVVGIFAIAVLFSLWFTALSNTVALVTRDRESTIIGVNLLQLPLLFLSSSFLPLEVLPRWVQVVAVYNPVTYGVDAIRALMFGRDMLSPFEVTAFSGIWNSLVPATVILLAFAFVFGSIAVYYINRSSSSEVQ